ncbi:MAG: PorV/PorQ family protein [candidate division WOR-3 bacterium]
MISLLLALSVVTIDPNVGTAGFDFLHITPTAREAAMAGAATGSGDGAMSFWFSPAHLTASSSPQAHLGYCNYIAGIHLGSLAYSQPLGPGRGVGLGIVYLNSGRMKRTDEQGNELGTFGVSYADVNISGALEPIPKLSAGVALQGLYGSIDTFYTIGLAGNLGLTYELPLTGMTAGLAATNLGFQLRPFQTERDPMPMDFAIGLGYRPNPSLNLALDLHKSLDNRIGVRAGIEGWVAELLVLRVGYNTLGSDLQSGAGDDILAGITTGLGVRYRNYQLDYCFVPMLQLGLAHRISLSFAL